MNLFLKQCFEELDEKFTFYDLIEYQKFLISNCDLLDL